MVYENILEAVGNTPLIRLHHMTGEEDAQIFVKFEAVNVGASIKTRTALGMIKAAEREGKITLKINQSHIPALLRMCKPYHHR